jgi:hypothetical protein
LVIGLLVLLRGISAIGSARSESSTPRAVIIHLGGSELATSPPAVPDEARLNACMGLQGASSQAAADLSPWPPTSARFAVWLMQIARLGGSNQVTSRVEIKSNPGVRFALVALSLGLPACSSPTAPPKPPGGGETLVLSYTQFQQAVEPVLVRQGCDATGDCHGGGIRGTYELSPPSAKDDRFDFDQSTLQVYATDRTSSPILTAPLSASAGGTPHPYKPFASTSDPDYQAIAQWVMAGTVK